MSLMHWNAELHRGKWTIFYDPTPGGKLDENGSRSFGLVFPALQATEFVSEPEEAIPAIVNDLNTYDELVAALRDLHAHVFGPDPGKPRHEIDAACRAVLAKVDA
jgi:hypothetical protein